ncbi:hypothetical protein [Acetobacter orientalis]|uniref:Uncharacterized protein n=1 Tax=Acetobacter orientalis TaxID=146474 RepID=A0A0D6NMT5_9PROT|nr:hypothetical protein [Acetobacter orientalis]GAN66935.1 hypothetical protein Abor_031_101 [Acetobacter orientalis]GBR14155.1 hypothetical protein AA0481_0538 [Acetobacter orientalis NRIC 0481]GEL60820.1 hypothetical protein AOR02nite_06620 [Acetobacter orientalis]
MDRQILYPAQIPLVEDGLNAQRNAMVGVGHLASAAFGANTVAASGFACSPADGLAVTIAPGALLAPGVVDASAYGTLAAVSSALVRQFISRDPVSLTVPSAGATYVVYVTPQTVDADNTVLPFYNAADPSVTYAGQNNSGLAAPTVRRDEAVLAIGSSVPSGASPLWQIVVPAGATTLTADMLSIASGAPFYPSMAAVASRIIAPFNAQLAVAIGGYPLNAVVADPATPGTFWVSTADANVSTPGADGATWQSLFSGYATEAWANGQFLRLAATALQTVTGPVTFSSVNGSFAFQNDGNCVVYDTNGKAMLSFGSSKMQLNTAMEAHFNGLTYASSVTDWTTQQVVPARDADARYAHNGASFAIGATSASGISNVIKYGTQCRLQLQNDDNAVFYDNLGSFCNLSRAGATFSSPIKVPDITDFTGKNALNAETAEGRYQNKSTAVTTNAITSGTVDRRADSIHITTQTAGQQPYVSGYLEDGTYSSFLLPTLPMMPTAGTITGGTYTKTPLNDGTGRSVLVQSFMVDTTNGATAAFPIAYTEVPTVAAAYHDGPYDGSASGATAVANVIDISTTGCSWFLRYVGSTNNWGSSGGRLWITAQGIVQ